MIGLIKSFKLPGFSWCMKVSYRLRRKNKLRPAGCGGVDLGLQFKSALSHWKAFDASHREGKSHKKPHLKRDLFSPRQDVMRYELQSAKTPLHQKLTGPVRPGGGHRHPDLAGKRSTRVQALTSPAKRHHFRKKDGAGSEAELCSRTAPVCILPLPWTGWE